MIIAWHEVEKLRENKMTFSDLTSNMAALSDQVVAHFSEIAEVQSIYVEIFGEVITYWVFTNEPQYDSGLMDRLIGEEMVIMDALPHTHFDFHYIPMGLSADANAVIGAGSPSVFQRQNDL